MHVSVAIKQVLITLAIILLLVQPAYSIVWDDVETIEQQPTPKDLIKQYGLLANASLFLHLQTDIEEKYPTILLVCSEDQYYMIHDNERICDDINRWGRTPCSVVESFVSSIRLMYYVPEYKEYYVSVVRCKGNAVELKIHLEMSNPKGNNLPSGLIPAATMLWLLAGVWGLILLCWLSVAYPHFKNVTKLQVVMMTFPVVKIGSSIFSAHYFHSFQVHGYSMEYWIEIVYNVLIILPLLDFHFVLLLISKSWSLSGSLTQSDLHFIFSMLVGLCCSLMFKNLYIGTNLTMLLSTLGYIGFRVMILAFVFINVNQTIGKLESEMLHYNADVETINNRPIVVRLHKIFVLLKFALMLWVILNVAEFFCNILFFGGNNLNWIDLMNTEFIDILLSICIGILLLPHPLVREVIITERESSHEDGELEEAPDNNNDNDNNNNNNNNNNENEAESTVEEESTITQKRMEEGTNENGELELTTFSSLSLSPLHPPNQRPNRASSFNNTNTVSTSPPFHFDAISLDFTQDAINEQEDDTEENVDINGNKLTKFNYNQDYNNEHGYNEHDYNNEYDEHSDDDIVSDDEVALVDRRKRNVQ